MFLVIHGGYNVSSVVVLLKVNVKAHHLGEHTVQHVLQVNTLSRIIAQRVRMLYTYGREERERAPLKKMKSNSLHLKSWWLVNLPALVRVTVHFLARGINLLMRKLYWSHTAVVLGSLQIEVKKHENMGILNTNIIQLLFKVFVLKSMSK